MAGTGPVRSLACEVCCAGYHPAQLDPLFPELCPPCAATAGQVSRKCSVCLLPRLWRVDAMLGRPCRDCQRVERDVLRAIAILGNAEPRALLRRLPRIPAHVLRDTCSRLFASGRLRLVRSGAMTAAVLA
ncbi:MAG: hypothetical protein QOI63_744 [Thermoplasmata archaeon]|jgi:hypothetical protein|nr:hypothetical protein [Thermoplasmata archaeon]